MLVQVSMAQKFGLKGGVNFANMSFSSSGYNVSPKSIVGFHFGPVADFKLSESLCFNTGILYSLKGFKMEATDESMSLKLNYLEIPLNLAYNFSISETSKFFIQAGPYLGYALSGKSKYGDVSESINFKKDGMKRFDFGLGAGLGLELGPIVPSVSYQLGFSNINDGSEEDAKVKNKVFQISVAYMFGK
jgi:hypothetical protein